MYPPKEEDKIRICRKCGTSFTAAGGVCRNGGILFNNEENILSKFLWTINKRYKCPQCGSRQTYVDWRIQY